jgi:hypothetical protein
MSKKIMRLIDPSTGYMECKVCGDYHVADIKPRSGGHYYRGSWQCRHGCKLEQDGAKHTEPGQGGAINGGGMVEAG